LLRMTGHASSKICRRLLSGEVGGFVKEGLSLIYDRGDAD